ncbi:MAG: hypothetical protein EOL95_11465 [Bacteroidia bacterium]|nr:hypothetical protein [Bacteroidia bacterium]
MKLLNIFQDFNLKYANNPIQFEDVISSDGIKSSYELSYSPLCDYSPYRPIVTVDVDGLESTLLDGVDYTIDYEAGVIRFINIPPEGEENVRFLGFYQKCNLKQFINHYNMSVRMLQTTFPARRLKKIEMTEDESGFIKGFHLSDEEIAIFDRIAEIYQNEDDEEMIPFAMRGETVILNPSKNLGRDYSSPGDYGGFPGTTRPGIKSPFYILGDMKYKEFTDSEASLNETVDFDNNSRNQIILLIARFMYESWLHRSWSLTTTVLNFSEISQVSKIIMSLDMQLFSDLRNNFNPKVLPSTEKKEYKA